MKVSKSNNRKKKIHLNLIQSKIPFGCTKSVALRYFFQIFTKSCRVIFEKKLTLLHLPYENFKVQM